MVVAANEIFYLTVNDDGDDGDEGNDDGERS